MCPYALDAKCMLLTAVLYLHLCPSKWGSSFATIANIQYVFRLLWYQAAIGEFEFDKDLAGKHISTLVCMQ